MDKSEPSLIPEWLKSSGSSTGGGTTTHPIASSLLHSDDNSLSKSTRNRSSSNTSVLDTGRSLVPDRTTSSYFRRSSSSNGYAHSRAYGRSNRERDREKDIHDFHDKGKSILGDLRHRNYSDPLGDILSSSFEKDALRRSQSMTMHRKVGADSSSANKANHTNNNALLRGASAVGGVHKAAFERDFPTLGAEERTNPEIGRASSPGLSSAIQSLPIGTSTVIGGDGWTSALAEVPVIVGNNGTSVQQTGSSTTPSMASGTTSALNMAETLTQGPSRTHAAPQLSTGTQRLEELAIKQSRQLIPMTPSMPKALVLNPSEKAKPKSGQHQISSSHLLNPSPRGVPSKSDVSKPSSVGKLHILKPGREKNGVAPTSKDTLSPTSSNMVANSPLAVTPVVVGSAPLRSPRSNNPNPVSTERKPGQATSEKRPISQAQSRNDFFNLMRKKSVKNAGPSSGVSSSVSDKSEKTEDGSAVSPRVRDDLSETSAGDCANEKVDGDEPERSQESLNNEKIHSSSGPILCSEEKEAAFLRSLGWVENAGEDEALTPEEIDSFYRNVNVNEYIRRRPTSRIVQGLQPKLLVMEIVGDHASSDSANLTPKENLD